MPFLKPRFSHPLRSNSLGRSLLYSFLQNGRRDATNCLRIPTRCVSSVVEVPEYECDMLHDDVKATEKYNALHLALSRLSGDFSRESMLSLQRFFRSRRAPVVSTGSLKLDLALGIGGLPKNGRRDSTNCLRIPTRCVSSVVEVPEYECDMLHDDVKATEKYNALHLALSRLSDDFSRESMLSLQRFFRSRRAPVVSTGSLKLDLALGIGGLPKGRIVEIYGYEASGKTTLGLQIIKEAQRVGGYCAYLDVENAMSPSFAESMGINTENLLISRPDSAENLLSVVDALTKSGSIDVIVIDSVAALVPQREIDVQIGVIDQDTQSQIMTRALRKIHSSLCRSETLIVFINQVRSNVKSDQGFGHMEEVTCGGNALRFYAAVRLKIIRKGLLKSEDKITGLGVCVQVVKNKLAPAMKKAEMEIRFGKGICRESDALDLACEHGLILEQGGSYVIRGEVFGSKEEATQYLAKNEGILDKLVMTLRRLLLEKENR